MKSSLTVARGDSVYLIADDVLAVTPLVNHGSIDGFGTILTDCETLENDGEIAETITILCENHDAGILITEFAGMEDAFANVREKIETAVVTNNVPMTREDYQNL